MKLISILVIICVMPNLSNLFGQLWQSISKTGTYETVPYRQFIINPYNNSIWLVNDLKVSVIENNGDINIFTDAELGTLWINDNIHFAFTPTEIYYALNIFGLYTFTGYNSNIVNANIGNFKSLSSNEDTIYITMDDLSTFKKYCNGTFQTFYKYYVEIDAKNQFLYGNNGSSAIFNYLESTNTSVNLTSDPDYLFGIFNDTKFSRHSDTLYVGGKKGISFAYNYDFLDTITPNNTLNMPSPNVLEMEFDHLDSLWAVFGDVNDVPFAIAKLEGNTWTNVFDSSNSPIDFSNFLGLEIDTLGNLWVADNMALHTLLTPNSPSWLGLHQLDTSSKILIQPNPASESLTISGYSASFYGKQATIIDLSGKSVLEFKLTAPKHLLDVSSLKSGLYFVKIGNQTQKISIE